MNVSELLQLTHWITREIVQKQVADKYSELYSILQQNANPNSHKQPFETQKENLIKTIKSVRLDQLTKDQLIFLFNLEITMAVGNEGIENLEDILYKNGLDISTAASKVHEYYEILINGIAKSEQIKAGLAGCVQVDEYEVKNDILIRVTFTGNASMSNVSDFKKYGNAWYDIGRGIAMAHNATPEDVKIVGASKGSIVIELAVVASIASTVGGIILAALKVSEKVLDIRIKAQELRAMKMKNDKFASELEKEAEVEKKAGIAEISCYFSKSLELTNDDGQGDKIKALETAIKNLVNFVENGGIVDFVIPEEQNDINDDNKELRLAFQEIKKLENKIALLEDKNGN